MEARLPGGSRLQNHPANQTQNPEPPGGDLIENQDDQNDDRSIAEKRRQGRRERPPTPFPEGQETRKT